MKDGIKTHPRKVKSNNLLISNLHLSGSFTYKHMS